MIEEKFVLRNYAHIGDAVWELFVRDYVICKTSSSKQLHKMTTDRVNATFQKEMLDYIFEKLTPEELELVRRARNLPIPIGRRSIQAVYRQSTAFETLIGYWYLHDKERLDFIYKLFMEIDYFN